MNKKIKLSALSKSLRNEVLPFIKEGKTKLSQFPKGIRDLIVKETYTKDIATAKDPDIHKANEMGKLAFAKGLKSAAEDTEFQKFMTSISSPRLGVSDKDDSMRLITAWQQGWSASKGGLKDSMMNSEDVYYQAGAACGKAMRQKDQTRASRQSDWLTRAVALETGDNKTKAQAAFDRGYREENPQTAPTYFRENDINETGKGDERYIDAQLLPVLADETQYGYSLNIKSVNVKSNWMTISKQQLIDIIEVLKRG